MNLPTVGYILSRIRSLVKGSKQDAFLTDRYLFSLVSKHAAWLLKRQDGQNKLMRYNAIFQTLKVVELVEVDRVEADCAGIKTGITFMRTKDRLPALMQGYYGPLLRAITMLDGDMPNGTTKFEITFPTTYTALTRQNTFRYNKTLYCWFLDGYLYFPNTTVQAVRIEGVFTEDISRFNCGEACCLTRQEQPLFVPEYLHGEIESNVLKDLGMQMQVPEDGTEDNKHPLHP